MAIFTSYSLDFLFITETWLKHDDLMPLVEIAPLDCAILVLHRPLDMLVELQQFVEAVLKVRLCPLIHSSVLKSSYWSLM